MLSASSITTRPTPKSINIQLRAKGDYSCKILKWERSIAKASRLCKEANEHTHTHTHTGSRSKQKANKSNNNKLKSQIIEGKTITVFDSIAEHEVGLGWGGVGVTTHVGVH